MKANFRKCFIIKNFKKKSLGGNMSKMTIYFSKKKI